MTSRPRHLFLPLLCGLALPGSLLHAQQTATLQQHMGNRDFHESGLDKLDPAELKHLQQWLSAHAAELAAAVPASEAATASAAAGKPSQNGRHASTDKNGTPSNIVINRIAGNFKGWGPHTVLTLQNGQQWRVIDNSQLITGKTLENPEVTIKPALMDSWLLMVKGYSASARVAPAN